LEHHVLTTVMVLLMWCTTEKKTLDDYDAEQRRTLTMQGGTNAVPLPAWMTSVDSHSRGEGAGSSCNNAAWTGCTLTMPRDMSDSPHLSGVDANCSAVSILTPTQQLTSEKPVHAPLMQCCGEAAITSTLYMWHTPSRCV
jgi:hypothetical protein